jgi:hypothetical protein
VEALAHEEDPTALVELFGSFDLPAEPQPLAKSLSSAHTVVAALRGATWDLLDQLGTFEDDKDRAIREALHSAAQAEEAHSELAPALRTATQGVVELLRQVSPTPPPPPPPPPVVNPDAVELVIDGDDDVRLRELTDQIKSSYAQKQPGKRFRVRWGWE